LHTGGDGATLTGAVVVDAVVMNSMDLAHDLIKGQAPLGDIDGRLGEIDDAEQTATPIEFAEHVPFHAAQGTEAIDKNGQSG
jgi:hypothetical protein